jgi:outer membrane cobalamin receptor
MTFARLLALVFFIFFAVGVTAQSHTISGYIRDSASEENLIGATVVDLVTMKGSTANAYGFFSITLTGDSTRLAYSYVGYNPLILDLALSRDTVLVIRLVGSTLLTEVTVNADRMEDINEVSRMGTVHVPVAQIKRVPAFMGETDVIKVLQLLPGVQGGNEGGGGLYVRGGGPDQNLILLDGVTIYNPSHLYGFFSTFNPDVINHVELVKGGFPARYGGRLSSVVDISMREGDQHKFHGHGSIGIISAKFALEGPIIRNRTSFIVSARRSYLSLLNDAMSRRIPGEAANDYRFYDLNAKVNHRINANNRVYLSAYTGTDYATNGSVDGFLDSVRNIYHENRTSAVMNWGNSIASLRWNHTFGKRLFSNMSLNYSRYRMGQDIETSNRSTDLGTGETDTTFYLHQYRSGIRDYIGKIDFDFIPSPDHYLRFGGFFIDHEFSPGALAQHSSEEEANREVTLSKIPASEFGAFIEDDVQVFDRLKINAGIHASAFHQSDTTFYSFQPRLSGRYSLPAQTALKASFAVMQQYIHLLSNSGMGMPTDLWVPSTSVVPPQKSWQVAFGGAKTIRQDYEFSIEAFYKHMDNVIDYKDGASYLDLEVDWQDKVEIGQGRSYGTEFFLQKKVGQWSGWIGYTLSWTERQFNNLNDGNWYPYRYDRRHDIKITSNYALGDHWEFSATWVFGTGNSVTVPLEAQRVPQGSAFLPWDWPAWHYESRNNFRMRNYHRLDLNVSYKLRWRATDHAVAFSVYNAYARSNPFYLQIVETTKGYAVKQTSLFPILPSVTYSINF